MPAFTWQYCLTSMKEVGKQRFYSELRAIAILETRSGNDTYEMRKALGYGNTENGKFTMLLA